jgi:hypothetical protein
MTRVGFATERVEVERSWKWDVRERLVVLCIVKDVGDVWFVYNVDLLVVVRVGEEQRRTRSFAWPRSVVVVVVGEHF